VYNEGNFNREVVMIYTRFGSEVVIDKVHVNTPDRIEVVCSYQDGKALCDGKPIPVADLIADGGFNEIMDMVDKMEIKVKSMFIKTYFIFKALGYIYLPFTLIPKFRNLFLPFFSVCSSV
jgi:hypothetical protein